MGLKKYLMILGSSGCAENIVKNHYQTNFDFNFKLLLFISRNKHASFKLSVQVIVAYFKKCAILIYHGENNSFEGAGMAFNATFNNISFISRRSVLLVEETGVPGENHRSVASHWQTPSHNVVSSTPRHEWDSMAPYKSLDDDVWFVFDQQAELDFENTTSLKQHLQSTDRYVVPLGRIIPTSSWPVVALPQIAVNTNCIISGSARPGIEPTIYHTRRGQANKYITELG